MSDTPTSRNRLGDAASQYLRDHAENPVNWQLWDEEALAIAHEHDVPIFLSIGYTACHWCHVMADESFVDDTVAEVLNRHFVPIKVDREERPDLDRYYQTAGQLSGQAGGWPLSAWLTPDGRPFQLATYLPKSPSRGLPGFVEVLERIAKAWERDRTTIENRADQLAAAVTQQHRSTAEQETSIPEDGLVSAVANDLIRVVDLQEGGFQSSGPKFPQVPRLELLLRAWLITGRDTYSKAVERSLTTMTTRGLYDHLGGGFHRYSTDPRWEIPHFEKMLYDNAMLLGLLAEASYRFEEPSFERAAHETASFLEADLRHPDGGFYSALGADADGVEGATYVWTPTAVETAIDDHQISQLVLERFGIDEKAEVADGNVLRVETSIESLAEKHDLTHDAVVALLEQGRKELLEVRRQRPQPPLDDKVLASWNGLAISGYTTAGTMLDEPAYHETALETLGFVEDRLYDAASGQLYRRYHDTSVAIQGFLEDYAAIGKAIFELASATGQHRLIGFGVELVTELLDRFWEPTTGELRFSQQGVIGAPGEAMDTRDRSIASPIALTVGVLADAAGFVDDDRIDVVLGWIEAEYGPSLTTSGVDQAALALALERYRRGPPSITIVEDTLPEGWRNVFRRHPWRPIVTTRPVSVAETIAMFGLDEEPPLWRNRTQVEGRPTAYPCRGMECGPPVHDPESVLNWFEMGDPTEDE